VWRTSNLPDMAHILLYTKGNGDILTLSINFYSFWQLDNGKHIPCET
jgi:hypothetical protein